LRRFALADLAEFVAYRSSGQVARFQGWDAPYPHEDGERFTIDPGYQGHGYATEAAALLVGYLFTERAKHRVTASCDARNAASAAVLRRPRMRQEGHLRESTWANGEWTDDLLYGLLRYEWNPPSSRRRPAARRRRAYGRFRNLR
jgi:aminoglycoside 6'-N-acetyltransferase